MVEVSPSLPLSRDLHTDPITGQVIVIGATNRPDAIDPALRRPGRFDREFYFPLPNLEGRRKILDIHTSGWVPPIEESFKDELAHLTKGYGGADLRVSFVLHRAEYSTDEESIGAVYRGCVECRSAYLPADLQDERTTRYRPADD